MVSIDPRKLDTFRVVVEAGSISGAAKVLHLSQPAVTSQVHALEEECGRPLLIRTGQGVLPNAWGLRVLHTARQVRAALEEAVLGLQGAEDAGGELVLAATMTSAAYVLPPMLVDFRVLYPDAVYRVTVANTAHVTELVATGEAPLGLVEGLYRSPRVGVEPYLADELVAVASESAPALHRIARAGDLLEVPLLLREPGSGTRAMVEAALAQVLGGSAPLRVHQLGSNQAVKMAVMAGLGVAFVSRWSVALELAAQKLRVLPIAGLRIARTFSWALPAREIPGLAGKFLAWARKNPPVLR